MDGIKKNDKIMLRFKRNIEGRTLTFTLQLYGAEEFAWCLIEENIPTTKFGEDFLSDTKVKMVQIPFSDAAKTINYIFNEEEETWYLEKLLKNLIDGKEISAADYLAYSVQ